MIRLAVDERLRRELVENLKRYLEQVVSWEVVAGQYNRAYQIARRAAGTDQPVVLDLEF
ncbi:MAG: hypothetical protein ACOC8N_05140 [Spirochaetota bacterium]